MNKGSGAVVEVEAGERTILLNPHISTGPVNVGGCSSYQSEVSSPNVLFSVLREGTLFPPSTSTQVPLFRQSSWRSSAFITRPRVEMGKT